MHAAVAAIVNRQESDRKHRDYYFGQHRLTFATQKFLNAFGPLVQAFADNLCATVVDAVADRLEIEGFSVDQGDSTLGDTAWKLWLANRMDRRAGEAHQEALTTGDAFVIVWPGADPSGAPVFFPNRSDSMTVTYDQEMPGRIDTAAKLWLMGNRARLNMYYPDRIEKYITAGTTATLPDTAKGFVEYDVPGELWPLPNPYGQVPVFHLANNAATGQLGRSELANIIPLQDALNKTNADRLVAAEFMALPQRFMIGIEPTIDPDTGRPIPMFTPGADRVWQTGNEGAKFGQFEAAELSQLREESTDWRLEICRVSAVPLHYLMLHSGDFPSGEAQRAAETRFLKKIEDRQGAFGTAWQDVINFAMRVLGAQGGTLRPLWKDPAPYSELQHVQATLIRQQIGVSVEQCMRELGYSEVLIEQMAKEKEAGIQTPSSQFLDAISGH
jgi:hypothetical protein